MRIALNAMQVRAAKSGVGQYIEGLLDGFLDGGLLDIDGSGLDITTYCTRDNEGNYQRSTHSHMKTKVWGGVESRKSLRLLHEIFKLGQEVRLEGYDLFHGPSNFLPLGLKTPAVVTIHDLSYYVEPERCPFIRRQYWYAMTRYTVHRADRIIADSENTRRDLIRFFPGSEHRIRVVPLGIHNRFQPDLEANSDHLAVNPSVFSRIGLAGPAGVIPPYVLSVCTLEPGKNLGLLVSAFECLAGDIPEVQLILVGDRGWKFEPLLQQIQSSRFRDRIRVPGHLEDAEIVQLMQNCQVFAYPSRYEGFGLPPLEALACGVPVVSSSGGSLREVLHGLPGVTVLEPSDLVGWSASLAAALRHPSLSKDQRLAQAEAVRARYDWRQTAQMTAGVWTEACNGGA